jgi:dTDP-4-dehydrorhamnose 3,5-epimerase
MFREAETPAGAGTDFTPEEGRVEGCSKDAQSVTPEWEPRQELIQGVRVKEVRNVLRDGGGVMTEIFRRDWAPDGGAVEQVFQSLLLPGVVTAWHAHRFTTDRLFVSQGAFKVALYDGRRRSPTYGLTNEFRFGSARPALLTVPPGVWHGAQNISAQPALLLNLVDRAYSYEDPDHWRLPADTDKIPYAFGAVD